MKAKIGFVYSAAYCALVRRTCRARRRTWVRVYQSQRRHLCFRARRDDYDLRLCGY